ncbi:MAG: hypothetical protein ACJ79Y_00625, partial [Myxococcales bacterium]
APESAALAERLAALEEGPMRVRAAARALASTDAEAAARLVAVLVRAADPPLRVAAAAVARALGDPRDDIPYEWLAALYAAAADKGLTEVTALLAAPPPHRPYLEPRDKADARLAHLTLGHKKALARAHRDPDLLARLAAEGEPSVVLELLRNPQLTEEFVVRIAARRPCRPGTLRCLFESRRWRTRSAVALAIARNPYAEVAVALELLPGIGAADLREMSHDGTLHPLVRAVAARLTAQRRP